MAEASRSPIGWLLARLDAGDIHLVADGSRLRVDAPKDALTPELRDELKRHKDELLAHLRARAGAQRRDGPIARVSRQGRLPLSHNQRSLWFLKQLDPHSAAYNMPGALRLRGRLDAAAIEGVLAELAARHEGLRTRFVDGDEEAVCIIEPRVQVMLERADLDGVPPQQREQTAMRVLSEFARRPFHLDRCPLLHAMLLHLAPDDHVLCLVVDHIIADGLSVTILFAEFEALYTLLLSGRPARLPAPAIQPVDYAAWQRRRIAEGALERVLAFWKTQLRGAPPMLDLPTARARPPIRSADGDRVTAEFPAELTQQLRTLARTEGATLFMILMAAFQILLHRYSGQTDVVVGSAVANRDHPEVEHVVGFFANNILLRGDLSGSPTVRELLQRVRRVALEAYEHGDMPFDVLVEELAPKRDLSRSPLFQVMLVLQTARRSGLELPGLTVEPIVVPLYTSRFDIAVDLTELVDDRLLVHVEYSTELYEASAIERMIEHYRRLLAACVAVPEARIGTLPLLPFDEWHRVLTAFNATEAAYPDDTVFARLFEAQVAQRPQAPAVGFEGATLSYAELNARANRLAHRLRALGVERGSLVGVCLQRGLELAVALVAVHKSGAAYVPLDPRFPADRLAFMLADSGAVVMVTATTGAAAGIELPSHVAVIELDGDVARLQAFSDANLEQGARPDDLAYVIYTSGSTGRPKGVAVPHGALVNFLWSMKRQPGLTEGEVVAAVTTISFDIAGLELYLPWIVGASVELISSETAADGAALAERLAACGAGVLQATPSTWRLLLEAGWRGSAQLRALCGGEALSRELADALLERVGELWNLYGPTETTIWSTIERVAKGSALPSIGRPIANTQIYVLDTAGEPVPIGVPGEIWIGGAGVAHGYHRRPELSEERFVADRFSNAASARLYRTGDLGRWDADGRLHHLGRLDQQVKVRGFRIELGEIEAVLAAHDAVRQAVVITREAAPSDLRLVAYVVYELGEDLTASEMRGHLRRELPEYMVPSIVVALQALPLTPNSKVDRAALPDPFRAALAAATAAHEAPAPGMERLLAEVWQELLQVSDIGAESNFFELGGHSLLALRVAVTVRKRTGWQMDPRALFFQNLRQIAATAPAAAADAAAQSTP